MHELIEDYRRLFLQDVPMLDIRAPVEFERGAFPNAVNRPLLSDSEREQVGIEYQSKGNEGALALGHDLITGAIKADRVSSWHAFADVHPEGCLYCFRGGQRSEIAQEWLYEDGVEYPRVKGGYKALRQFLINTLDRLGAHFQPLLIGGRTGVGKTELLLTLPQIIDLEGLANHRGSGFGRRVTPQPNQIDFENALAIALLKHEDQGHSALILEDESRSIGARKIPEHLWRTLEAAPVVVLEDDLESRICRTRLEYVDKQLEEFTEHYGEEGFERYSEHLLNGLDRISRRLGGARHSELRAHMQSALASQRETGSSTDHDIWIERLLVDYYDPMYDYQIQNKGDRIRFVGDRAAVAEFLEQHSQP
jgi:tRNA 2-selenouridine synthase